MGTPRWKEYELQISQKIKTIFPNCKVFHDKKVKGKFSKALRQVDVYVETKNKEGFYFWGVVECKFFSKKIYVPVVDQFIGFLGDVQADFGYLITNRGFSQAAWNRAQAIHLQVVKFSDLDKHKFDFDVLVNEKIMSLACLEPIFLIRQQQRGPYIDLENTSLENRIVRFKKKFVRTEYFVYKKLLEETARVFRDFPSIGRIKIIIPLNEKIYWSDLEVGEFERFLDIAFNDLHRDIKAWRKFLGGIKKSLVIEFARIYVNNNLMDYIGG